MVADGKVSVFVVRWFLLHRSRLATVRRFPALLAGQIYGACLAES
jgi:hypothetical protein